MARSDVIIIQDDDDEIFLISDPQLQSSTVSCSSSNRASSKKRKSLYSFYGICMDIKTASEMFENTIVCAHRFCSDCMRQHVAVKINENVTKVKCPDPNCQVVIGPEACRSIVPKEVFERWESILCQSVIMESQKFYCPFKDCSAMLVDDGGVAVTQSECPNCNRLFCVQCKVSWHCGMGCTEFQSLKKGERNPDDIKLMNLAKKKKWKRCPKCKHFVEKVIGCDYIACRCGHGFCYRCGQSNVGHQPHGCKGV